MSVVTTLGDAAENGIGAGTGDGKDRAAVAESGDKAAGAGIAGRGTALIGDAGGTLDEGRGGGTLGEGTRGAALATGAAGAIALPDEPLPGKGGADADTRLGGGSDFGVTWGGTAGLGGWFGLGGCITLASLAHTRAMPILDQERVSARCVSFPRGTR